ncbi:carbohydrate-binding protein [Litoreibacter albidus]|uniref:Carbohydrate-binding protein n=1 Tax=Litoreibacter albidus TaxID=670155 RepID=A0A1H3CKH9_9RHOB|nr:carbohydrate-binding protein [Litoreibacter albidus]SDX53959.1 hypothetical protein SAMN04488001_3447 [Litoreibacter albidus]
MLTLEIKNKSQLTLAGAQGTQEVGLHYRQPYNDGDTITLSSSRPDIFLIISLDSALPPTFIFLKDRQLTYAIPFGQLKDAHPPTAFDGNRHRILVREAYPEEVFARRNLALNPHDLPSISGVYPHSSANVETRNEAVFFARNAIDGETLNTDHGKWPFSSWGINCDENAALTVEFGREVLADKVVVHLRADFPHDAWWTSGRLVFSNGFTTELPFEKTAAGQSFSLPEQRTEWVRLEKLIKADDPSPFPALTQIQVWGTHI